MMRVYSKGERRKDDVASKCRRLTKRAVDGGDSATSRSIFLASGFSCSQALSKPAPPPLTQTVGRLVCDGYDFLKSISFVGQVGNT